MSALETEISPVLLLPVIDSRPPAYRFGEPGRIDVDDGPSDRQPSLLDALRDLVDEPTGPPRPRGVRIHRDTVPGAVEPAPGLPDPGHWAGVLGQAIGQALVGSRPVGQLECWLEPGVLADLRFAVRERARAESHAHRGPARTVSARRVSVRVISVRVQLPTPRVAEAAIHLRTGVESQALAVRLAAYGRRWVCTALARPEPGGTRSEISDPSSARGTA